MTDDKIQPSPKNYFIPEIISLFDILKYLWKLKYVLLIFLLLSLIYSSHKIRNAVFEYEVKLSIVPLEDQKISFSSIQGLNEVLGIKSNSREPSLNLYKSLIRSEYIAEIISKDLNFMKTLAGPSWDIKNNSIIQNEIIKFNVKNIIKKIMGIPIFKSITTNSKFVFGFLSKLNFRSLDSGMTEIYIATERPKVGQDLLQRAHDATEKFLKKRNKNKTLKNIEFINSKLSKPIKSNSRSALIKMLVEQNQSLMIASSDIPFVAETFSSPVVSEFPVSPNAKIIIALNAIISIILFFIFSLLLFIFNNKKPS